MLKLSTITLRERLHKTEWSFIKGSSQLSLWIAVARVLGLAFSLVLARVFSPSEYGAIQYALTLAALVSIGTEPFGMHVIAQYAARQKDHADELGRTLANISIIQIVVFGLSLLISAPVIWLLARSLMPGIFVVFLGQTVFYSYWGLARGFLAANRLAAAYLGSNLVQILLVIILIQVLGIHSVQLALIIYGTSYFLPLILLQRYWPLCSPGLKMTLLNRKYIWEILKFSLPIWISQIGYVLFSSIDTLLLEYFSGTIAVGVYRLNKTIAMVFLFVPQGIASILLPQVAASPKQTHGKLLMRSLTLLSFINIVIIIFYLLLLQPFVKTFFGLDYLINIETALLLALGSIILGMNTIVVSVLVGRGRPEIETIGRLTALTVAVIAGLYLIPTYSVLGATLAVLMGASSSLFIFILFGLPSLIKD